jgi:hypothetical protein
LNFSVNYFVFGFGLATCHAKKSCQILGNFFLFRGT